MSPSQKAEFEHPHYGWTATSTRMDSHLMALVEALRAWNDRDLEQRQTHYGRALEIERVSRNISADTAQLARLSSYQC